MIDCKSLYLTLYCMLRNILTSNNFYGPLVRCMFVATYAIMRCIRS